MGWGANFCNFFQKIRNRLLARKTEKLKSQKFRAKIEEKSNNVQAEFKAKLCKIYA